MQHKLKLVLTLTIMLSRNFKVTLIESNPIWGDVKANIEQLHRHLLNVPEDTDLVVLPELFSTGFMTGDKEAASTVAERISGDTITLLHRLAAERHIAFAGSFLASTASRLYNRAFFIEPNGDDVFYDKHHLFNPGGENEVFTAGTTTAPIIRYRGINFKLIVCYDLRFPVFCRNNKCEYDVLLVVANWPLARIHAWRTLLTARAIENQCYVCGVNRCGTTPDGLDHGEGTSVVLDYRGKVIGERMGSPVITADLSPASLQAFRDKFPAWRDADSFTIG